jgi:hypothetical protein
VEHNSGFGHFSAMLARRYPQATVISIESDTHKTDYHVQMLATLNVSNNAVCVRTQDSVAVFRNVYECPELFRYQLISHGLESVFVDNANLNYAGAQSKTGYTYTNPPLDMQAPHKYARSRASTAGSKQSSGVKPKFDYDTYGESVGALLSSALTSFVRVPTASQVSHAMTDLFALSAHTHLLRPSMTVRSQHFTGTEADAGSRVRTQMRSLFADFQSQYLLQYARVTGGHTQVAVTPMHYAASHTAGGSSTDANVQAHTVLPLVRVDIVNMTRHVHHHYDYARDGHTRTYTMRIGVNQTVTAQTLTGLGFMAPILNTQSMDSQQRTPAPTSAGAYSKYLLSTNTVSVQEETGIRLTVRSGNSTATSNSLVSADNAMYEHNQPPAFDAPGNTRAPASPSLLLPPGYHTNNHVVTSVHLLRDRDDFPIPYTSLYGVTLITLLRLGLQELHRDAFFEKFLKLPMYEDMAPWNIVLMGPVRSSRRVSYNSCFWLINASCACVQTLDYIDYDTKMFTYDAFVPKAYMVG